ncbi:MAG TPA: polysaccharide deacetylase [Rhizobiales bacterium]|nr:polysaccharide deacetylase [Hyphomicrobiales bacterium]
MSASVRVCSALLVLGTAGPALARPPESQTQFVIISFDGAHDLSQWQRSRALAKRAGASFTYFLSCVFLLSPETKSAYAAPGRRAGRSNVGFALSKEEVAGRLGEIWAARAEGHEIASHGCGHFDGGKWSAADWKRELDAFAVILRDAYSLNGIDGEPAGWKDFAVTEITGFRAPYLSTNDALRTALVTAGYAYDASGVSRDPAEPEVLDGLVRFALPQIPEGPSGRRVVAMDYNLFVRHSGGVEREDKDGVFEQRTLEAFRKAFDREYRGSRAPLQIGFHFTLMNGGAYWRALERFAEEVCGMADVECVGYRDYLRRRPPSAGHAGDGTRFQAGG